MMGTLREKRGELSRKMNEDMVRGGEKQLQHGFEVKPIWSRLQVNHWVRAQLAGVGLWLISGRQSIWEV